MKPVKFRKRTSPAFNTGEEWISTGGSLVKIVSTRPCVGCSGRWDWEVTYITSEGRLVDKDGWNFQVRYEHVSDGKYRKNKGG